MPEVGKTHNVVLDNKGYLIKPYTYTKSLMPPPVASAPTIGAPVEILTETAKQWVQNTWAGGVGQEFWADRAMYWDGFVDSYSHPRELRCLQATKKLANDTEWNAGVNSWVRFAVRGLNETDSPRLYVAVMNLTGFDNRNFPSAVKGEVYRFREDLDSGKLKRIYQPAGNENPVAMGVLGKQDPFTLGCAFRDGKVRHLAYGAEGFGSVQKDFAPAFGTWFKNFNDADYYAASGGTAGAKLYRNPPTTVDQVHDINHRETQAAAVWNSRLWFLSGNTGGTSKLWVTDGTIFVQAYEWEAGFYAKSLHAHGSNLYVGGVNQRFSGNSGVGMVWRYNGATMDLIGQFDDTGLTQFPRFPTNGENYAIHALSSWGQFLVVPSARHAHTDFINRQGVYFYDPEEDAWHYGAHVPITDPSAAYQGIITDVISFDGRLFMGCRNTGALHYVENDTSTFTFSQYVSSVFDGALSESDKNWTKIKVRVKSRKYTRVAVEYSLDRGVNWTLVGYVDGPTSDTTVEETKVFSLGPDAAGVKSKDIQLRLTLYPGDSAGTSYGLSTTGNRTPVVRAHVVEYDVTPAATKRHTWSFTLMAVTELIGPDGTVDSRRGQTIINDIWALIDSGKSAKFQDVDGSYWLVKVRNATEYQQRIEDQEFEGHFADIPITLEEQSRMSADGSTVID